MSSEPRKRTRVACDTCRKKKIRCDGKPRCLNCVIANEKVCHYEERPPKKTQTRRRGRMSNGRNIDFLNSRIQRLENVVLSLTDKLGGVDKSSMNLRTNHEIGQDTSNTDDEDDTNSTDESSGSEDMTTQYVMNGDSAEKSEKSINMKLMELYFGTHSFLSIFSASSLNWISQQLGPDHQDLMTPFTNMPLVFQAKARLFLSKWIDPVSLDSKGKAKLLNCPFSEDSVSIMNLIDTQYKSTNFYHFLASYEEVRAMFVRYYAHKNSSRRIFSVSQLLKMTIVLLASLVGMTEHLLSLVTSTPSSTSTKSLPEFFTSDRITQLQEELLNNAIQYYLRICVISEGLETVEALLLFSVYLERNCITPEIGYMILSLAVRYAQDLGLHRIETYEDNNEMNLLRSRIWAMCCFMDMESCFRSGRSPLINYNDVSPSLETPKSLQFHRDNRDELLHKIFIGIFRMRLQSYNSLFSAKANLDSFSALQESLDFLNSEMQNVAILMPPNHQAVFYNDPRFKPYFNVHTEEDEVILTVLLSYFTHMMVVNRLPLMFNFPHVSENVLEVYRDLSLNSARTVLHLVKNINREELNESFGMWCMFFPLSAFLSLLAACMNQPNSPDAIHDLNLMIDISRNFIGRKSSSKALGYFAKMEISTLLKVLFKSVLKITITIFEKKTGVCILETNESLKEHLDLPARLFPELYSNPDDFKASLTSYASRINAKSPFAADTKGSRVNTASRANSVLSQDHTLILPLKTGMNDYGGYLDGAINPYGDEMINETNTHFYDDMDSLVNSQISQFPNFFFDNNIQF
ncbi:CIC11C00000004477 [Sungouiella intermedia]|uniref:CIC11C00000004477 n=1 Tax=Sungouiella intermedia TaxID=45354 RepID=A0A1L0C4B7_9ASCO|nr:CIC11C00000004477 [[Candida] intermedia]